LAERLRPGDVAVDATVGNGNDTLVLARLVSPGGRVYGFDIQEAALAKASDMISRHGLLDVVTLIHRGHETMCEYFTEKVDAIVFNLGYLPGGDHNITTNPATTVRALENGLGLLNPGGVICIVVYTGHQGGKEEQRQLEAYLGGLDKKEFCVGKLDFLNRGSAPFLIIIEKKATLEGWQ